MRVDACAKLFQRRHLGLIMRDDQLSASRVGDAVGVAELVQHARPGDAVPGFERPRRIVDASVDDLAVMRTRRRAWT